MHVELDDTGRLGPLSGRVGGDPDLPVTIEIGCTRRSPFGIRYEAVRSMVSADGAFTLARPTWPPAITGELMTTTWVIRATSSSGVAAERPFDVECGALAIESADDDDLDGPAAPVNWLVPVVGVLGMAVGIAGLVTGFGTDATAVRVLCGFAVFFSLVPTAAAVVGIRQRSVLGEVRCRIDPHGDRLEVTVVAADPGAATATTASATLLVVELASRRTADGRPTELEHIVHEHTADLVPGDDGRRHATIPVPDTTRLPPSSHDRHDDITTAVSWVVRIALGAPRTPRVDRVMPLVALPPGLPAEQRPRFVEVPKVAR